MKSVKLLLYLWPILLSCNTPINIERNVFFEEDLPKPVDLKGHKHSFPEILNPKVIHFKEDYLIIGERKSINNNKIHIIDIENKKHIQSKGMDGLGPGETTVVSMIEDKGEDGKFWTFDPERIIFSKFDLYDSIKTAEEQVRSPQTAFFVTDMTWASDSSLLVNLVDGWTKYLELTIGGDTLKSFGNWADMIKGRELPDGMKEKDLNANLVSNIHQGVIRGNKSKSRFIKVGIDIDFIDIIDLNKEKIQTLYGPVDEIPDFEVTYSMGYQMPGMNLQTLTSKYIDAFAGEDSFFVLYLGKSYRNISDFDNLNRIFELDYEGNILHQYQLDYPLFGFTVDETSRKIYGVSVDQEPNVVEFSY